jgi:hypothetical protein
MQPDSKPLKRLPENLRVPLFTRLKPGENESVKIQTDSLLKDLIVDSRFPRTRHTKSKPRLVYEAIKSGQTLEGIRRVVAAARNAAAIKQRVERITRAKQVNQALSFFYLCIKHANSYSLGIWFLR